MISCCVMHWCSLLRVSVTPSGLAAWVASLCSSLFLISRWACLGLRASAFWCLRCGYDGCV